MYKKCLKIIQWYCRQEATEKILLVGSQKFCRTLIVIVQHVLHKICAYQLSAYQHSDIYNKKSYFHCGMFFHQSRENICIQSHQICQCKFHHFDMDLKDIRLLLRDNETFLEIHGHPSHVRRSSDEKG